MTIFVSYLYYQDQGLINAILDPTGDALEGQQTKRGGIGGIGELLVYLECGYKSNGLLCLRLKGLSMVVNLKTKGVVFTTVVILFLSNVTLGKLVHRYSFNDGTARDSIGNAHGVLYNNTGNSDISGGVLTLGNDFWQRSGDRPIRGDYVDLPNGIISALGDQASFEFWTTWLGGSRWQKIMAFGTSDGGEDESPSALGTTCVMLTPFSGNTSLCDYDLSDRLTAEFQYGPSGTQDVIDHSIAMPVLQETHIVVTFDGVAGRARMYVNGQLSGERYGIPFTLTDILDNNNWLGRSQWNDPMYRGIYNEVRIYDSVLTTIDVRTSYNAGPDVTRSPVITNATRIGGVTDGQPVIMAGPSSRGLQEDSQAYMDRWGAAPRPDHYYHWQDVPDDLLGADYVKTYNDDKMPWDSSNGEWWDNDPYEVAYVVTLGQAANLYIFIDRRYVETNGETPFFWLTDSSRAFFTDTGLDIMLHEEGGLGVLRPFDVYGVQVPAGTYILGATCDGSFSRNFYGIAAKPVHEVVGGSCIQTYESLDAPKEITDMRTVESIINVTDSGLIADVNVKVNLDHIWFEDIKVILISPDGKEVRLMYYPKSPQGWHGNSGFDDITFDDEASKKLYDDAPDVSGSYRPKDDKLSWFDGKQMKGTWVLEIEDDWHHYSGQLNSWSLTITRTGCN